jgi:hypothetical protein
MRWPRGKRREIAAVLRDAGFSEVRTETFELEPAVVSHDREWISRHRSPRTTSTQSADESGRSRRSDEGRRERKRTMTEPRTEAQDVTTDALELPGATLAYDIRTAEAESGAPALLMIASPMDASGFTTLAKYFPDRTVVTYDPRGVSRSKRADAPPGRHQRNTQTTCTA